MKSWALVVSPESSIKCFRNYTDSVQCLSENGRGGNTPQSILWSWCSPNSKIRWRQDQNKLQSNVPHDYRCDSRRQRCAAAYIPNIPKLKATQTVYIRAPRDLECSSVVRREELLTHVREKCADQGEPGSWGCASKGPSSQSYGLKSCMDVRVGL